MQETWVRSLGWEDPWKRERQAIPVFLPREFHGQRSLVGYSLPGHKELDMIERLTLSLSLFTVSSKSQCLLKWQIFGEREFIFSFLGGTQTPILTCQHLKTSRQVRHTPSSQALSRQETPSPERHCFVSPGRWSYAVGPLWCHSTSH